MPDRPTRSDTQSEDQLSSAPEAPWSFPATCSNCGQTSLLEDWQLQRAQWVCPHCEATNNRANVAPSRPAPSLSEAGPEPLADPLEQRAFAAKPSSRRVGRAAMRTAGLVIALNVVLTIGIFGWARATHAEPATGIAVAVLVGVIFYVLTFLLVIARMDKLGVQPMWLPEGASHPVAFGALVGVSAWTLVAVVAFLLTGHLIIDSTAALLVAGANPLHVLLAVALLVVAGPWIEELLFRGLVLESLRPRGAAIALVASSVLFAICHLHGFLYYSLCGAVLGGVYLKSGLKASLWTHAAFNACFVVTAIAVTLGPAHTISLNGMTLRVPPTWRSVGKSFVGPTDFAAAGPSGAQLVIGHSPMPATKLVDLQRIADDINQGAGPQLPGMVVSPGAAYTIDLPAGAAVEVRASIQRHAVRVVLVPTNGRLWTLILFTGGSGQAENDFTRMLGTVRFTGGP